MILPKKINSTDCTNKIKNERFTPKKIDNYINSSYKNVKFLTARRKAQNIDSSYSIGNIVTETISMRLFNGIQKVIVKITGTPSSICIQSKNIEDEDYIDYDVCLDSMVHGVILAEELQNNFNKRLVKKYRKYLRKNEPTYNPNITNKELFQILVNSRESEF